MPREIRFEQAMRMKRLRHHRHHGRR
jgi:hypothetical protein